jgi:hypothetical protein
VLLPLRLFAQGRGVLPQYEQSYQQAFQQLQALAADMTAFAAGTGLRNEPGKPFSATVITKINRPLADGSRTSETTTALEFRDADGRTRVEAEGPRTGPGAEGLPTVRSITIRDTVAGANYDLDPVRKIARYMPRIVLNPGGGPPPLPGGGPGGARGGRGRGGAANDGPTGSGRLTEDLGTQRINGVMARGSRVTTVIPIGAIGNDHEVSSITERWFSDELDILVRSISNDPRFGETDYERTNISTQVPDPALFRVPPDYEVVTAQPAGGRRGGR